MNFRVQLEENEIKNLHKYAAKSGETKGRKRNEKKCSLRTAYMRDRDRIIHSKSFRRLIHKTQVFISPEGDHYRTRLTHTLEVAQISKTIAKALVLNEDLTEAIALGHDLGHTPFGHAGEKALNKVHPSGFHHNEQSLRVVDVLESRNGSNGASIGLNLTWEVRDGILKHTGHDMPETLEGQIVKTADRIAYINHDIEDALRAGIIKDDDVPPKCVELLGNTRGIRIDTMVKDMVFSSYDKNEINMSPKIWDVTMQLRQFLFDRVYSNSSASNEAKKAENIISMLYHEYINRDDYLEREDIELKACDYIAGMTDRYALARFRSIFLPASGGK